MYCSYISIKPIRQILIISGRPESSWRLFQYKIYTTNISPIIEYHLLKYIYSTLSAARVGLIGFNVGLEQRLWAIADGLGLIPKDDPEICHRNFDPSRRGWLSRFGTPRGIIRMVTWRTLHLRRILHASGAISKHGSFSPGEPRTRALQSRNEYSADWATEAL